MKYTLLLTLLLTTGCVSNTSPHNVAEREEDDGSKGEFPPGRSNNKIINYNGHGLSYNQFHRKYYNNQ